MIETNSRNFYQFGVLRADVDTVLQSILNRFQKYQVPGQIQVTKNSYGPADLCESNDKGVFDLSNSEIKVISSKGKNYSIYKSSLQDGWYSMFYGISKDLKCDSIWIRSSYKEVPKSQYVQNFEIYKNGQQIRLVNLYWDRKWIFYEKGDALDNENKINYIKKDFKDRLHRHDLVEIMNEIFPDLKMESDSPGFSLTIRRDLEN
jgi:hypothetical protein